MRKTILALTIATLVLPAIGGAQAQVVDDGYEKPPFAIDEQPKPVGPRVYGYYEDADPAPMIELERPSGPGGCGEFFFWNGDRCVDARNKPL